MRLYCDTKCQDGALQGCCNCTAPTALMLSPVAHKAPPTCRSAARPGTAVRQAPRQPSLTAAHPPARLQDVTSLELGSASNHEQLLAYCGFDPTAESLHLVSVGARGAWVGAL